MNPEKSLRLHLQKLFQGHGAHMPYTPELFRVAVKHRGRKVRHVPYTPWSLLEHLRIAQWDIYRFCVDPTHESPKWPDGYWPEADSPPGQNHWARSVRSFFADLESMQKLVLDPKTDLYAPIPGGTGQTILREALLVADHNAYHIGQFVTLLRSLDAWKS